MTQDIGLDTDYDLAIEEGDFVVKDSTYQHAEIMMLAEKGDLRQYPFLGVGIKNYINDDSFVELPVEIEKQLDLDKAKIIKLQVFETGKVELDISYDN